jgi:hypothetical protein
MTTADLVRAKYAWHEAGHLATARAMGLRGGSARIVPNRFGAYDGVTRNPEITEGRITRFQACMLLRAGHWAERMALPRWVSNSWNPPIHANSDEVKVCALALADDCGGMRGDRYLAEVDRAALMLLAMNWRDVTNIYEQLMKWGRFDDEPATTTTWLDQIHRQWSAAARASLRIAV